MADLISRAAAINELGDLLTLCRESMPNENGKHYVTEEELCIFYMRLANISAVDAVPVVHARWKSVKAGASNTYPFWDSKCSECGYTTAMTQTGWLYCPHCGAKMDGERRE